MAIKRLFITTGLISLLNALTIIKMQKSKKIYEDYLIIYSFMVGEKFIDQNIQLAHMHSFKEIEFLTHWNKTKFKFDDFDEIYSVERILKQGTTFKTDVKNIYLFDEGINYIAPSKLSLGILPKKTYYWNYVNKFYPIDNQVPNVCPDINIFHQIVHKFNMAHSITKLADNSQKKALLTGQYVYDNIMSDKQKYRMYYKVIKKLIHKNFIVYIKSHPRENINQYVKFVQKFPNNCFLLDTDLPIELCDFDFTVVVSATCNSLFTLPYFRSIPSCAIISKKFFNRRLGPDLVRNAICVKEYIPTHKRFFNGISKSMSHSEAKTILINRFNEFLSKTKSTDKNIKILKTIK